MESGRGLQMREPVIAGCSLDTLMRLPRRILEEYLSLLMDLNTITITTTILLLLLLLLLLLILLYLLLCPPYPGLQSSSYSLQFLGQH